MTFGVGLVVDAASAQAVRGTLAVMEELFEPVDTGRRYLNFVEEPTDPARFFDADAYARLRHVKAVFDPYRIIRANHPIRPRRRPHVLAPFRRGRRAPCARAGAGRSASGVRSVRGDGRR